MRQRGERRRPGAALEAGNRDMVGTRLGHAGGDRSDTDLGHQLHRNPAQRMDALYDQLPAAITKAGPMPPPTPEA
jgi:hypothetical protein